MKDYDAGYGDALRRAHEAMALAGHPDSTWSVVLEARLTHSISHRAIEKRLVGTFRRVPSLGPAPDVIDVRPPQIEDVRNRFANLAYSGGAVTRVGVASDPTPSILLAAHHGALDGLGLLGLLAALIDEPLTSSARGLTPDAVEHRSFALHAARRVGEALFRSPERVTTEPPPTHRSGDHLLERETDGLSGGTVALVAATARAVERWNQAHGTATQRLVLSVGASRRPGTALTPEDRSAHVRVRLRDFDDASVAAALAATPPEPDVPRRRAGSLTRALSRFLSPRLGSSVLVSNLGAVSDSSLVSSIAFWPVPVGRPAVAIGAAGSKGRTVATLRVGRIDFEYAAAAKLLDLVCDELLAPS